MTIELVYDRDCPNAEAARAALGRALEKARLPAVWTEWELSSPATPARVRTLGSPAVLIDGRDIAGVQPCDAGACRLYEGPNGKWAGVPDEAQILRALRAGGRRVRWQNLALVPGIAASLLPNLTCPACWPAYAAVVSALGLGFLVSSAYLFPITAPMVAVAVGCLFFQAAGRYGPAWLGATAAVLVLAGKFLFDSKMTWYVGAGLLVAASLWSAWRRRSPRACACALPKKESLRV